MAARWARRAFMSEGDASDERDTLAAKRRQAARLRDRDLARVCNLLCRLLGYSNHLYRAVSCLLH